jgi:hypothetical protein
MTSRDDDKDIGACHRASNQDPFEDRKRKMDSLKCTEREKNKEEWDVVVRKKERAC